MDSSPFPSGVVVAVVVLVAAVMLAVGGSVTVGQSGIDRPAATATGG